MISFLLFSNYFNEDRVIVPHTHCIILYLWYLFCHFLIILIRSDSSQCSWFFFFFFVQVILTTHSCNIFLLHNLIINVPLKCIFFLHPIIQ